MANHKIGRLSEDIKREISALFRELKDPRISSLLSVIRCEVSGCLSHCEMLPSPTRLKGCRQVPCYVGNELFTSC